MLKKCKTDLTYIFSHTIIPHKDSKNLKPFFFSLEVMQIMNITNIIPDNVTDLMPAFRQTALYKSKD